MESSLSVGWAITFLALFLQSYIKSSGKSQFSLSFLSSTVNDVRRKLYTVVIHSTVGKRAKRMLDTTVETTHLHYPTNIVFTAFLVARGLLV